MDPSGFVIQNLSLEDLKTIQQHLTEKNIAQIRHLNNYMDYVPEPHQALASDEMNALNNWDLDGMLNEGEPSDNTFDLINRPASPTPLGAYKSLSSEHRLVSSTGKPLKELYDELTQRKAEFPDVQNLTLDNTQKVMRFDLKNVTEKKVVVPMTVTEVSENTLKYSTTANLPADEFEATALKIAHMVVETAKPRMVFHRQYDLDTASTRFSH